MLYLFILFILTKISSSKNCLVFDSSSGKCLTCNYTHYEKNYLETVKLSIGSNFILNEEECFPKNPLLNKRKVLVLNSECKDCDNFDAKYESLGKALEEESKIATIFLNSQISFYLQEGTHYIFPNDFSVINPELFRRSLSQIFIQPFISSFVSVVIKTNLFFIFVSESLSIENVNFYGNDISMNQENIKDCSSLTATICCLERKFYLDESHSCFLDVQNLLKSINSEARGLFNIEKMIDFSTIPIFTIKNCNFYEFNILKTDGFMSIISIALYNGNISLYNINVTGSYFLKGFTSYYKVLDNFYAHDFEIIFSINHIVKIENPQIYYIFQEVYFNEMNLYFNSTLLKSQIFSLFDANANITLMNSIFFQISNTNIFMIRSNMDSFFMAENVTLTNLSSTSFIISSSNLGAVQINKIVFNVINNAQNLMIIKNTQNLIIESICILNAITSENIGILNIESSISRISSLRAQNCKVFSVITNSFLSSNFSNCSFTNIFFTRGVIYLIEVKNSLIENSIFSLISGPLAIFYYYKTDLFILQNTSISKSTLSSVFYADKANIFIIRGCSMKANFLDLLWRNDQTCQQTFISDSEISNNLFSSPFYRNVLILTSSIFFENVLVSYNNFTSKMFVNILAGRPFFNKFICLENIAIVPNFYGFLFTFQNQAQLIFTNSIVSDCGIRNKKSPSSYQAFTDNTYFYVWQLKYGYIDNTTFIASNQVELVSGFISGSPTGDYLEINNCNFILLSTNSEFGYKGLLLDGVKVLKIVNNTFTNIICNAKSFSHMHGSVYVTGSSSYSYSKNAFTFDFQNNSFYNCSCFYGGNLAVISIFKVNINNCSFEKSKSVYTGGALLIISSPNVNVSNIYINESQGTNGGALYFQNSVQFSIWNVTMILIKSQGNGAVFLKNLKNLSMNLFFSRNTTSTSYGGFIFILDSYITMNLINIFSSSAQEGGSFFIHGESNVFMNNVQIKYSSSYKAGVISISNANNIVLKTCNFENSVGIKYGAVIVVGILKNFLAEELIIQDAFSKGVGIIFTKSADETAVMKMFNIVCKGGYSASGSFIYHLSAIPIIIEKLKLENNGLFPIFFQWSFKINTYLIDVIFLDFNIESGLIYVENIFCQLSFLKLINSKISGSIIKVKNSELSLKNGTFFNVFSVNSIFVFFLESTIFYIENIFMQNNIKNLYLSILNGDSSNGEIRNLTSINLYPKSNSLFEYSTGNLYLSRINFTDNFGILLNIIKSNIKLENSLISNLNQAEISNLFNFQNEESSIYDIVFYKTSFFVKNSLKNKTEINQMVIFNGFFRIFFNELTFSNEATKKNIKISALFCQNTISLIIFNSKFLNFSTNAILIKVDHPYDLFINEAKLLNCSFRENSATSGAALYLIGQIKVSLTLNEFLKNSAIIEDKTISFQGVAAVIFFTTNSNKSLLNIFSNTFLENKAANFISTVFSEALIEKNDQIEISNNSDDGRFFSFPFSTRFIKSSENNYKNQIINVVSGKNNDISFEFLDNFGNLLFFESSIIFTVKLFSKEENKSIAIENYIAHINNGIISFSSFKVKINPDSFFKLTLISTFRGKAIQNNYDFYARPCYQGEIIQNLLACYKCPRGFYSLIDPMRVETKYQACQNCPANSECPGGDLIYPIAGYFRRSNLSISVMACITPDSCLGSVGNFSNLTVNQKNIMNENNKTNIETEYIDIEKHLINGICIEGNSGNLCYYCDLNYGRDAKDEICKACSSILNIVVLKLLAYVFIVILYISLNFNFAESFANSQEETNLSKNQNNISTFFKFIVNHSQQISFNTITNNFSISGLIKISDYIALQDNNSMTNDCLIQKIFYDKETFLIWKDIFNLILPIIFSIFAFFFWIAIVYFFSFRKKLLHLKEKLPKNLQQIKQKFYIFMFLSTFIFYALILRASLNLFNCRSLDTNLSTTYLKYSPNTECWVGDHLKFVLAFGIPGVSFWGFLFPLFLTYVLYKNHKIAFMAKKAGIDTLIDMKRKSLKNPTLIKTKMNTFTEDLKNNEIEKIFSITPISKKQSVTDVVKRKSLASAALDTISGSRIFFFFFKDCKDEYYYYEALIFIRKFLITFINTLDEKIPDELKVMIIIFLVGIFINFVKLRNPYKFNISNNLEISSLALIILTNFSGLVSNSKFSSSFKVGFMFGTLMLNLSYFGSIAILILKNSFEILKAKKIAISTRKRMSKIQPKQPTEQTQIEKKEPALNLTDL